MSGRTTRGVARQKRPIVIVDGLSAGQREVASFLASDTTRTYEDAANHFEIPIGTVRSRLFRARVAAEKVTAGSQRA